MNDRVKQLLMEIQKMEQMYQNKKVPVVCFNHITEVYYYEYFVNQGQYKCAEINLNIEYRNLAEVYEQEENYPEAEAAYQQALNWNPADLDAIFALCEVYKKENDLSLLLEYTGKAYPFCVTRATLAHYYRNLGFYYLESYQPDLSRTLYEYSNLYFHTEQADNEMRYLEKALGQSFDKRKTVELIGILEENHIPVWANPVSLKLTYEAGKFEEKAGRFETAKECYRMVYDLTQDEELERKLFLL